MTLMLLSFPSYATDTYKVSTAISIDGNELIYSVICLKENEQLSASFGDDFNYSIAIEPQNSKKMSISGEIRVGEELFHLKMDIIHDQYASMQMGKTKKINFKVLITNLESQ